MRPRFTRFERPYFSLLRSQRCFDSSADPLSDQLYQESLLFPLLILTPDLNRNLDSLSSTSASTPTGFKSSQFLDFFFKRLKPNPSLEHHPDPYSFTSLKTRISDFEKVESQTLSEPDWTQVNSSITDSEIQELALKHEYLWLSPCQGEMNFIKALDSPVVFKELIRKAVKEEDEGDFLKWGGSFEMRFQPEKLLVCKESGYLYHPSPLPSSRRNSNQNQMELISPYGPYSLLSSSLVLSNLSDSLELDLEAETGSFVWNDKKYEIGIVDRDRLFEERRRRKEDG